ncbi:MAG: hypothetical protein IJW70_11530 [Clostridia bacterium]|nr:hypothetical protein [Clostridia bacterium]
MNKSAKIAIIVIYSMVALLTLVLVVGLVASVAKNGVWGTVENVVGDYDLFAGTDAEQTEPDFATQEPDSMLEALITDDQESVSTPEPFDYQTLFDFEMQHKPTYEDYLKIQDGMTVEQVVEILGKPHDLDAAAGSKYLTWEMADGGSCWVKAVSLFATENPTEWSEILQPHYGGATVAYHNCSVPDVDDGK